MSVDTKVVVEKKFMKVFNSLFDTFALVASQLAKEGHNAPNPKLITISKKFLLSNCTSDGKGVETLIVRFARKFHKTWQSFFSKDFGYVEKNIGNFFGDDTPEYCHGVIDGIIGAKNTNGESAIPGKSLDYLFKLFQGLTILAIKEVFWLSVPTNVTRDDKGNNYTFATTIDGLEELNINESIRLYNIPGLPSTLVLTV
jgi:hypothetical protein